MVYYFNLLIMHVQLCTLIALTIIALSLYYDAMQKFIKKNRDVASQSAGQHSQNVNINNKNKLRKKTCEHDKSESS